MSWVYRASWVVISRKEKDEKDEISSKIRIDKTLVQNGFNL